MKKLRVLGLLAVTAMAICAGCGKEEKEPEKETTEETRETREETDVTRSASTGSDEEEDWRTWADFRIVEWETPDYYEDLYLVIYEGDSGITVVHDYDEYTEMCLMDLGGIGDEDTVWDSLQIYDIDDDGYDDFWIEDTSEGYDYSYAFIYYPGIDEFVLDEDLSNTAGADQSAGSAFTAYEEAYIPILQYAESENDMACYYLFNINDDVDDVLELIVEEGDDRTYEVYTVGLDDEGSFYAQYVGTLGSSADYGYVTMDAYDGDNYDGMLTVNECVQGVRWLYAYTLDSDYELSVEEVYEVEEGDDYQLDGELLDRFSVSDWDILSQIDIQY